MCVCTNALLKFSLLRWLLFPHFHETRVLKANVDKNKRIKADSIGAVNLCWSGRFLRCHKPSVKYLSRHYSLLPIARRSHYTGTLLKSGSDGLWKRCSEWCVSAGATLCALLSSYCSSSGTCDTHGPWLPNPFEMQMHTSVHIHSWIWPTKGKKVKKSSLKQILGKVRKLTVHLLLQWSWPRKSK